MDYLAAGSSVGHQDARFGRFGQVGMTFEVCYGLCDMDDSIMSCWSLVRCRDITMVCLAIG